MKHLLLTFLLGIFILFLTPSCNEKSSSASIAGETFKPDTSLVFGVYVPNSNNDIRHDLLLRITREDSGLVLVDGGLYKPGLIKDSVYGYPFMDTLRKDGVPQKDSLGNYIPSLQYLFVPKHKVWDSGLTKDSIINKFTVFLKKDSTQKK